MSISPQQLIFQKREGRALSDQDIRTFLTAYLSGDVHDYQMSALLMSIVWRGLTEPELSTWTEVMIQSGHTLKINRDYVVDKHSTGGVGDKTSFIVAPIVAALGCYVPMISGRSLGHTGGTLDKLESIPGVKIPQTSQHITDLTEAHGLCFAGQTPNMCPLDRKLYALRDVTGTVESPDLISSSIMSKKISEGLRGLTLDIKCGNGAFMKTIDEAQALKKRMKAIAQAHNLDLNGVISDMNQPLGRYAGVRPEIYEVLQVFREEGPEDLVSLCLTLASQMLVVSGKYSELEKAKTDAKTVLENGKAYQKFCNIIKAQGGDISTLESPDFYLKSSETIPVSLKKSGYLTHIDTRALGSGLSKLGAGRTSTEASVDPQVGCLIHKRLGDPIEFGEPILTMYLGQKNDIGVVEQAADWFEVGSEPPDSQLLLQEVF
jgi:pyrimidine-nucleoside phosphorylase